MAFVLRYLWAITISWLTHLSPSLASDRIMTENMCEVFKPGSCLIGCDVQKMSFMSDLLHQRGVVSPIRPVPLLFLASHYPIPSDLSLCNIGYHIARSHTHIRNTIATSKANSTILHRQDKEKPATTSSHTSLTTTATFPSSSKASATASALPITLSINAPTQP